jgi:outer membrane protein assembly factor BamB
MASGCRQSLIQIEARRDDGQFPMFGFSTSRQFYFPVEVSDSIILRWQNTINGTFPFSSVVLTDKFVFTSDLSGRIYCFNIDTGKEAGLLRNKGVINSAPILHRMWLIYALTEINDNNSFIHFYDFVNGRLVFELPVKGKVLSDLIKLNDGIIFTTENGTVIKYNFAGGKEYEIETNVFTHTSTALKDNKLIFGNDAGEIIAFDAAKAAIIYRKKFADTFSGGITISENRIFTGSDNGFVYVLDFNTGELLWEFNTGSKILMTPAVSTDKIFFGNLKGEFFSLNKFNGEMNWKTETKGLLNVSPLITKNFIILPDHNLKLHFIDAKNGNIAKTMLLEGRARLTPVFHKDLLFIGFDRGILQAYEFYYD